MSLSRKAEAIDDAVLPRSRHLQCVEISTSARASTKGPGPFA